MAAEREIVPQEAHKALTKSGVLFVDVRMPDEFMVVHVPGAMNIPLHDLSKNLDALRGKEIYLICRSGKRSSFAQRMLADAGITDTYNVTGGMIDWIAARLPNERG